MSIINKKSTAGSRGSSADTAAQQNTRTEQQTSSQNANPHSMDSMKPADDARRKSVRNFLNGKRRDSSYTPKPANSNDGAGLFRRRYQGPTVDTKAIADRALNADPTQFSNEQITDWWQTKEGNCVSVAWMKYVMDEGNPKHLPKFERKDNGNIAFTQPDGFEGVLTPADISAAAIKSYFGKSDSEAHSYATLLYATMGKRAADKGTHGQGRRRLPSIDRAINDLNNGEPTTMGARLLGLGDKVAEVDIKKIVREAVASSNGHAFFIDEEEGKIKVDHYGEKHDLDNPSEDSRFNIYNAYELVD